MKHSDIPARNAAVLTALRDGRPAPEVAAEWSISHARVRQLARDAGVELPDGRRHRAAVDLSEVYQPTAAATAVLVSIGVDPSQVPGRTRSVSARDVDLVERILVGAQTLDEAGSAHGLTRERARQIFDKVIGISAKELHERRRDLKERERRDLEAAWADSVRRHAAEHPEASVVDLADHFDTAPVEIERVLSFEEAVRRRRDSVWWISGTSQDDVFAEMRRIAALEGGTPLSTTFYDEQRSPDASVSSARIVQRFVRWSAACQAAGVVANAPRRSHYARSWSDADLEAWLDRYVEENWGDVSYGRMDAWMREHRADGAPSAQTIRNAFGGTWNAILATSVTRISRRRDTESATSPAS